MRTDLTRLTLCAALSILACGKLSTRNKQQDAPNQDTNVRLPATSTPSPENQPQIATKERISFAPVTFEEMQKLEHHILSPHAVAVDLHPYCNAEEQPPGSTERIKKATWSLREPDYRPLYTRFSSHPDFVSLIQDEERRTIVLLFEPGFTNWASIQGDVALPRRVPVELRPSCHTSTQREAARAIVEELTSDPEHPAIFAWQPEPRINGYRVYVLPGQKKEAAFIEKQLGSIANVWFTPYFKIVSHGKP